jgi:Fe-S cluster assembly iron-binding protein IscA
MINVTDLALEKIQEIMQDEPADTVIRINVKPG